ncbi:hypothetical protein BJV78DRAFT_229761 [Lactifluus subvellereus]|nr:hypothetical protein BJV78DRAFT_229761 [Lactifluus subvellereus]
MFLLSGEWGVLLPSTPTIACASHHNGLCDIFSDILGVSVPSLCFCVYRFAVRCVVGAPIARRFAHVNKLALERGCCRERDCGSRKVSIVLLFQYQSSYPQLFHSKVTFVGKFLDMCCRLHVYQFRSLCHTFASTGLFPRFYSAAFSRLNRASFPCCHLSSSHSGKWGPLSSSSTFRSALFTIDARSAATTLDRVRKVPSMADITLPCDSSIPPLTCVT